MKIYLKKSNSITWHEITENVNLPITINDTVDGGYLTANLSCRFKKGFYYFDVTKPITPKWELKIVTGEENEEELVNTFYFITTDQSSVKIREEILDEEDKVKVPAIYEHKISAKERLYLLEGKFMPDYSITQPKTQFFDVYKKSASVNYLLENDFTQNGNPIYLNQGIRSVVNKKNNDDNTITFDYDNQKSQHYVELKDVDKVSFDFNVEFEVSKSAPAYVKWKQNFFNFTRNINLGTNKGADYSPTSNIDVEYIIKYYDNSDNVIEEKIIKDTMKYAGRPLVPANSTAYIFSPWSGISSSSVITGLPNLYLKISKNVSIPKKANADKARVYVSLPKARKEEYIYPSYNRNHKVGNNEDFSDTNVYGRFRELTLSATSSAYSEAIEEKHTTLLEFVEKAIFDYNLNTRNKITLHPNLETVLGVVAKESEWVDYNFKELIERVFKFVNLRPYLNSDNQLTYREKQKVAKVIDFEDIRERQSEQVGDDFYDKAVNKAKNLVSENDFVKEILPVSAINNEFSQITSDNAGFVSSNNLYYVSDAILYAPGFEIKFEIEGEDDIIVKSNMNKDYHWDITSRLFEKDIYNSFPDVRYDIKKTSLIGGAASLRSNPELYSKSNTIFYESGSNIIGGLGHLAPEIPTFTASYIATQTPEYLYPEYSVMEMLIVLAYTQLTETEVELVKDVSSFIEEKIDLKYSLNMMMNFELEITYAPIFKELTTKYASNMEKRRGVNFEKKFNMTDRIVSYNETKSKLTNEMNRKGNVKELFSEKYRNLSDAMPVNSIINDNYYITSRDIELHNDLVMVDYVLQKDFLLENEDIRLPVSFDIYDIPYEYVNRELSIDNYLIFNDEYSSTLYRSDKPGANIDLIKKLFTETPLSIDGTIYGRVGLDLDKDVSLDLLVRMAKIDSGSTMILSGRFPDNYSAGLQRYSKKASEEFDIVYSQPFRYTNSKGKVEKITSLQLGWGYTPLSNLRLRDKDGIVDYDIKEYPDATNLEEFTTVLFGSEEDLLLNKDAREGLSFVHTSYLLSQNDDIKFYNFKPINRIGNLNSDIPFTDDLEIDDLMFGEFENEIDNITINPTSNPNVYSISVNLLSKSEIDFPHGVVLYNYTPNYEGSTSGQYTLVGLIRNPLFYVNFPYGNEMRFYVATTRYGFEE